MLVTVSHPVGWSFGVMAMVGLLVAGCGDDGDEDATSTSTTSGTPSGSVVVERDIAYATAPEGWLAPLLDVYAPADAEDLPLVVFFHGGMANKDLFDTPKLAEAIAGGGAVVVVANWGQGTLPSARLAAGLTVAQIIDGVRQISDEVACAVSYAVTHAEEYGADPTRLVLVGQSAGATKAGMVALTETSSFAGCEVPPVDWTARGLMLWEGDWFMAPPDNDAFDTDLPAVLAVISPWPSLANATDLPPVEVEFAVSVTSRSDSRYRVSSTGEWLALRDPTGQLRHDLEAVDALADGFVDIFGEPADVMVNALNARGVDASLLELTDPATTHEVLAEGDFDLMVEHVLALAGT